MIRTDSKTQLTVDIVAKVAEGKTDIVNLTHLAELLEDNEHILVKRACGELGIQIIFANSPQGKGRIARHCQYRHRVLAG